MMANTTIVRHVKLSQLDKVKLEEQCGNPSNWTDGGNWNSWGKAPNCHTKQVSTNTLRHTFYFPTDESANKWNTELQNSVLRVGHFATIGLSIIIGVLTRGWGSWIPGTIAAILKDEIQAKIKLALVEREWKCLVTITKISKWSPHPLASSNNGLTISTIYEVFDLANTSRYRNTNVVYYDFDSIPESISIKIAQMQSWITSSNFGANTILLLNNRL